MKCISYKGGYKYQLKQSYTLDIGIKPHAAIQTAYIELDAQGCITIREGYAWQSQGQVLNTKSRHLGSPRPADSK